MHLLSCRGCKRPNESELWISFERNKFSAPVRPSVRLSLCPSASLLCSAQASELPLQHSRCQRSNSQELSSAQLSSSVCSAVRLLAPRANFGKRAQGNRKRQSQARWLANFTVSFPRALLAAVASSELRKERATLDSIRLHDFH